MRFAAYGFKDALAKVIRLYRGIIKESSNTFAPVSSKRKFISLN